jgi:squalene-hopene/tetraprenyl-beta-curcumene cyclase
MSLALLAAVAAAQAELGLDSLARQGDSAAAEKALAAGVAWLRKQAPDGMWTFDIGGGKRVPSPATTALALAPIAAALPADQRAKDPLVKKACAFLLSAQREDGAIAGGGASYFDNYFTSSALMALAIVNDPGHAEAREKMKKFLLSIQRLEEGRSQGGFGYNKREGADLSNAQFAVEALRSAGVPEDHPAMTRLREYLERVQNRSENPQNKGAGYEIEGKKIAPGNDGSAGYEPGVSKAGLMRLPDGTYVPRGYGSMTYALLKCYLLAGLDKDDPRVKAAVSWLVKNYTWDENPGFQDIARERPDQKEAPYWGLFYYYFTAAKALSLSGLDEIGGRDWRKDLTQALVKRQRKDGSWINEKAQRWEEADPVIATAYAAIALHEILGTAK